MMIVNTINIKGRHKSILQRKLVTGENESTKRVCSPSLMLDFIKEMKDAYTEKWLPKKTLVTLT